MFFINFLCHFLELSFSLMQRCFTFTETVFKFKALKKVAQLAVINSLEKASIINSVSSLISSFSVT